MIACTHNVHSIKKAPHTHVPSMEGWEVYGCTFSRIGRQNQGKFKELCVTVRMWSLIAELATAVNYQLSDIGLRPYCA